MRCIGFFSFADVSAHRLAGEDRNATILRERRGRSFRSGVLGTDRFCPAGSFICRRPAYVSGRSVLETQVGDRESGVADAGNAVRRSECQTDPGEVLRRHQQVLEDQQSDEQSRADPVQRAAPVIQSGDDDRVNAIRCSKMLIRMPPRTPKRAGIECSE